MTNTFLLIEIIHSGLVFSFGALRCYNGIKAVKHNSSVHLI